MGFFVSDLWLESGAEQNVPSWVSTVHNFCKSGKIEYLLKKSAATLESSDAKGSCVILSPTSPEAQMLRDDELKAMLSSSRLKVTAAML